MRLSLNRYFLIKMLSIVSFLRRQESRKCLYLRSNYLDSCLHRNDTKGSPFFEKSLFDNSLIKGKLAGLIVLILLCGFLLGIDVFTYSNPYVKLANLCYERKLYQKSLELYIKAAEKMEDKDTINFNIANAYYKIDDFENAIKYFEKSLESGDSTFNAKVMFNMGDCYFKRGDLAKAYEKYKASLKLNPADKNAKYNLEFVLSMMSDNKKQKAEKYEDDKKDAVSRKGDLKGESNNPNSDSNDLKSDNEVQKSDTETTVSSSTDSDNQNDMDDMSPEDAQRILSTLTQQVMVRKGVNEELLTKRGEGDEKDW